MASGSIFDMYRNETGCDVHCTENQKILADLVANHVLANVNGLIEHLNMYIENLSLDDQERIKRLINKTDYVRAAKDEVQEIIEGYFEDYLSVLDTEFIRDEIAKRMGEMGTSEDFCKARQIDLEEYYSQDILSHHAVSTWLFVQLIGHGEAAEQVFNINVWGRTGNGQAIHMDAVIATIAIKEELLLGQRNCSLQAQARAA